MRVIVILLILVICFLGAGMYSQTQIFDTAHELNTQLKSIRKEIKSGNWSSAQQEYNKLKNTWNKTSEVWDLFLDHQERDEITISVTRLKQYIYTQNKALSLGEIGTLQELIMHIPEKEKLNIKNIL